MSKSFKDTVPDKNNLLIVVGIMFSFVAFARSLVTRREKPCGTSSAKKKSTRKWPILFENTRLLSSSPRLPSMRT